MLFDKKKEETRCKHCRAKKQRKISSSFNKFVFFAGATLAFKGLKGWVRSKKKK